MSRLMTDFGFTEFQAASIVGNLGHRFGGTKLMRETRPSSGTSGDGWAALLKLRDLAGVVLSLPKTLSI
jgi:hypothetical protein